MSCTGGIGINTLDPYIEQYIKEINIKKKNMSVRKFKDGDEAIVNQKIPSRFINRKELYVGEKVTIIRLCVGEYMVSNSQNRQINYISASCLDKVSPKSSIDNFEDQILKAQEKIEATKSFIAETKMKIEFLKEIGSETFDENEFKAFQTLTILEQGDLSKMEKAKMIAALISGK